MKVREMWWVCWTCGCDEGASHAEDLPERCPGHNQGLIAKPELLKFDKPTEMAHVCGHEGRCS